MKRIRSVAFLVVSLTSMMSWGQELPGVPMFGDDFSVPGLFAENWDASNGMKCEAGRATVPGGCCIALAVLLQRCRHPQRERRGENAGDVFRLPEVVGG